MRNLMELLRSQARQGVVRQPIYRRRSYLGFAFLALMVCLVEPCFAGGGPENLVLVVNADSPTSKLIANLYIDGRQIPAECNLSGQRPGI